MIVRDANGAAAALEAYRDYPKLASWLLLTLAGVPTLPGVIAPAWSQAIEDECRTLAASAGSAELLIRSDQPNDTGSSPRGGHLVALDALADEVTWYLTRGRVVFLLEPRSPFDDLYSLSVARFQAADQWQVEIVGGGFDASDLKRGDVTPHEVLSVTRDRGQYVVERELLVDQAGFERSKATRLAKVPRLLSLRSHASADDLDPVEALRGRGETLLIDTDRYVPIPRGLLRAALRGAENVCRVAASRGFATSDVAISLSYLGSRCEQIYWDVVWPRWKYRTGASRVGD